MTNDMSEEKKDRASCSCMGVEFSPIRNKDGSCTERWACKDCGNEFVKKGRYAVVLNDYLAAINARDSVRQDRDYLIAENVKLRDALRPFANMSECIENDKDFHIDSECWIKAKEVLSGRC